MNKKNLLQRAFLNAFGVTVYVVLFAWLVNNFNQWFGSKPDVWFSPVLLLLLFIVSACVTGSLVLLKPILLYLENQKKEAVYLFLCTIGFLVAMAIIVGFMLKTFF